MTKLPLSSISLYLLYLLLSPSHYRYMTNIAIVLYLLLSPSIFCYLLPLSLYDKIAIVLYLLLSPLIFCYLPPLSLYDKYCHCPLSPFISLYLLLSPSHYRSNSCISRFTLERIFVRNAFMPSASFFSIISISVLSSVRIFATLS